MTGPTSAGRAGQGGWTPGPWRHVGHGHIWAPDATSRHDTSVVQVAKVGAFHDAELLPQCQCRDRWMADARLIAAAPAMFEALQRALLGLVAWKEEQQREHPWSVDGWKIEEEVRAAIAAALPPDPSAEGVTG